MLPSESGSGRDSHLKANLLPAGLDLTRALTSANTRLPCAVSGASKPMSSALGIYEDDVFKMACEQFRVIADYLNPR